MADLPKMVWDPRAGKFVPLDTDGERVEAERRRIILALTDAGKVRNQAYTDYLEAAQTIHRLVPEGAKYHIPLAELAAAAQISRQAIYNHLPSEEEELAMLERETG